MFDVVESAFGEHLRFWRNRRGMSQLALGVAADVSQRHISFIETGRSKPSRELVRHLGFVLELPLREQNAMLTAAGFAPTHSETDPADLPDLLPSMQFIVDAHAPYMALAVDRVWDVVAANDPARRFAGRLLDPAVFGAGGRLNLMRAMFHPEGLRRFVSNWEHVWPAMLAGLERDAARAPGDARLGALAEEIREMPRNETAREVEHSGLLLPLHYVIGDVAFQLFTTIATVDAPLDVTVSELRLETFWPVDPESDATWKDFISRMP